MQQLSGHDASFVYFDLPHAPMHGCFLGLYDGSEVPGGVGYEAVLEHIERRLHLARCFRQKLVRVPFDWDHPYWLEDRNFDLEYHVREIALPSPGDWSQLCRQVARIHARPMDLTKPLWEMYLIEGLDRVPDLPAGSFALLIKFHHAAIDGASGVQIIEAIHDLEPDAEPDPPRADWEPETDPTPFELVMRAQTNAFLRPLEFSRLMARTLPALGRASQGFLTREFQAPGPVPETRFNGPISPHRVFDACRFALAEARAIKSYVEGATVNDVLISVCGGALRHYLESKGELPAESLVAMLPISVRGEGESEAGNRVSAMIVPIGTDVKDAGERLVAVREATRQSKELTHAVGARLLADHAQYTPGALIGLGMRLAASFQTAPNARLPYNVVITNVPGPQTQLHAVGARLITNFGVGIPHDGMGLMHGIGSYCGELTVGATACRQMMPDADFYAACLQRAYDDLKRATIGETATVATPSAPPPRPQEPTP
jgi:diacylglycerol O-acyltransferase